MSSIDPFLFYSCKVICRIKDSFSWEGESLNTFEGIVDKVKIGLKSPIAYSINQYFCELRWDSYLWSTAKSKGRGVSSDFAESAIVVIDKYIKLKTTSSYGVNYNSIRVRLDNWTCSERRVKGRINWAIRKICRVIFYNIARYNTIGEWRVKDDIGSTVKKRSHCTSCIDDRFTHYFWTIIWNLPYCCSICAQVSTKISSDWSNRIISVVSKAIKLKFVRSSGTLEQPAIFGCC